jgi:hypothetical protein
MDALSLLSQVTGYLLIALMGLYMLLFGWWQAKVLSGQAMENPDGSVDSWKV